MAIVNWQDGDGQWTDSINWSTAKVPTGVDDAVINTSSQVVVTLQEDTNFGSGSVRSLNVGAQDTLYILGGGGSLTVNTSVTGAGTIAISNGILNVDGDLTANDISVDGTLRVGGTTLISGPFGESLDGQVTFEGKATFRGGLTDSGDLTFDGNTVVNSKAVFQNSVEIAGSGAVTFRDDVTSPYGLVMSGAATTTFGTTAEIAGYLDLAAGRTLNNGGVLTFAPGTQIKLGFDGTSATSGGATLVNATGATVNISGATISAASSGTSFVNMGHLVSVPGAVRVSTISAPFDNKGTINVTGGTELVIDGGFTNTGKIAVASNAELTVHATGGAALNVSSGQGLVSLDGSAGDDSLTLTLGPKFTGGAFLDGGTGNNLLYGSPGTAALFSGNIPNYAISFDAASHTFLVQNKSHTISDTLSGIGYAEFADNTVPLAAWHFEVDRGQDGTISKIIFSENGKVLYTTPPGQNIAAYDDSTPILAGTYNAVYRLNGAANNESCWDLINPDGTSSVKGRSDIEIHVGNYTYQSHGCIVASDLSFLNYVRDYMDARLNFTRDDNVGNLDFYNLPIPITVTVKDVNGLVSQPKVAFETVAPISQGHSATTMLDLSNTGLVDGLTKTLTVFFTVAGGTVSTGHKSDITIAGAKHVSGNLWSIVVAAGQTESRTLTITDNTALPETITFKLDHVQITDQKTTYAPDNASLFFGTNKTLSISLTGAGADHELQLAADHPALLVSWAESHSYEMLGHPIHDWVV